MVWSESAEGRCKKHPEQHQSNPGVCSFCLRERLSDLALSSSSSFSFSFSSSSHTKTRIATSSFPSSLSSSSASSSTNTSPIHRRRNSSHVMGSIVTGTSSGTGLRKSRSMAFVSRSRAAADGKKKAGFWSKLLRSTGRKTKEVFKHSRTTVKETLEY